MTIQLAVDGTRLDAELRQLAEFSDCPEKPPAVTRVVFTDVDRQARDWLNGLFEEAKLQVTVDPIGNTFARWVGSDPAAPAVGTGSHIDAIPHAGMYDGTVGVLGGLEAIRVLQRAGYQPRRSIEVVLFTSEEPTRFGIGCSGSRLMSGAVSSEQIVKLRDNLGDDYDTVRKRAGYSGALEDVVLKSDHYHAWVELHIEQGPELEKKNLDIGIVSAIAAPASLVFTLRGEGGHAGAVMMPVRRDALCAAAELISSIESLAKAGSRPDLVATVGMVDVHPGAVNSIPSRVQFTLDIRDIDADNRDEIVRQISAAAEAVANRRNISLSIETKNSDPPAAAADFIMQAAEDACRENGSTFQRMISRAYHDSLFMARVSPISMIFIPCRGGVSHRPDEFSTSSQIARGVDTLARTLAKLAQ
jgi:N-carbamoyl-L-amino-acid hydrolase